MPTVSEFYAIVGEATESGVYHTRPKRVIVLGLGSMGCNTVERLAKQDIAAMLGCDMEFYAINTDERSLRNLFSVNRAIMLRTENPLGTGGDMHAGVKAVKSAETVIRELLTGGETGVDIVFLIAGLGGGTGSAAHAIASIVRDCGVFCVAFVALPFSHEGEARYLQAMQALQMLKDTANVVLRLENDWLHSTWGDLPITSAFEKMDEIILHTMSAILVTTHLEVEKLFHRIHQETIEEELAKSLFVSENEVVPIDLVPEEVTDECESIENGTIQEGTEQSQSAHATDLALQEQPKVTGNLPNTELRLN